VTPGCRSICFRIGCETQPLNALENQTFSPSCSRDRGRPQDSRDSHDPGRFSPSLYMGLYEMERLQRVGAKGETNKLERLGVTVQFFVIGSSESKLRH
jgi:hypothetical protein